MAASDEEKERLRKAIVHRDVSTVTELVKKDKGLLKTYITDRNSYEAKQTPLMMAALLGRDAAMTTLLELGGREFVGNRNNNKWTPAYFVCMWNHASTLALLLDAEAPLNPRDDSGRTPLITAALYGATECVRLLLARGGKEKLELDAQDDAEWTGLYWAAYSSNREAIELLLEAGADPAIRNEDGKTALDVAREKGHQPCIALLQAAVAQPQRPTFTEQLRAQQAKMGVLQAEAEGLRQQLTAQRAVVEQQEALRSAAARAAELERAVATQRQEREMMVKALRVGEMGAALAAERARVAAMIEAQQQTARSSSATDAAAAGTGASQALVSSSLGSGAGDGTDDGQAVRVRTDMLAGLVEAMAAHEQTFRALGERVACMLEAGEAGCSFSQLHPFEGGRGGGRGDGDGRLIAPGWALVDF